MEIAARKTIHIPDWIPLRALVVESSVESVFENVDDGFCYLVDSIFRNSATPESMASEDYMFFLGIAWDEGKDKMADIIGWARVDPKDWPGNPDIGGWVFRNGVYVQDDPITCENGVGIVARESEYRRGCLNLEQWINGRPYLGVMQPKEEL